jgi:ribonuclease D
MKPESVKFINNRKLLADCAPAIADAPALGVDTEFVRERTFFAQPGLLQFSDGERVWLLDPVAMAEEPAFAALVADRLQASGVDKILHSTGEDLEVLDRIAGAEPRPLFDTQRAAALLGRPLQMRYEHLAAELVGAEFPGGLGRNNWLRRPLPDEWLDYAAADVIALPALRTLLGRRLADAGRLEWLEEDCARLVAQARTPADPVTRIRGAAGLDDEALARLAMLADWRDRAARERDLPRGFVVGDDALLDLARCAPGERDARLETAGHRGRPLRRGDRDAIRALLSGTPGPFERPPELLPLARAQRERIKSLQKAVRDRAETLGVEPALLASRRDLTRWVQGANCEWLHGWRGEVLSDVMTPNAS